jgi:hypothetical protein
LVNAHFSTLVGKKRGQAKPKNMETRALSLFIYIPFPLALFFFVLFSEDGTEIGLESVISAMIIKVKYRGCGAIFKRLYISSESLLNLNGHWIC